MSHMVILNDYLAYLPTVYDSSMAVEGTNKSNVSLDEADLAGIVLNSVPVAWINQYNMMHSTLPKSPRALLPDLEAIKRVMDEKHQASLKALANEASAASATAKGSFKKHFTSRNPGEQVSKKAKPVKFFQDCKNKGSPHLTHNTKECHRYKKDGNHLAVAALKPSYTKKPFKKGVNKQMAYLMVTVESLMKKGPKKAMKSKKHKCHSYDSSRSSDFNLEEEIGYCDMEHVVDKHLKLDELFLSGL